MQVNDYYIILDLNYNFTPFQLLRKYFAKAKQTLNSDNKEDFVKVRMGYEVLRDYSVIDDYNRIYRKYILNEELNFPIVRESGMIAAFQKREEVGSGIAQKVIARNESFFMHLMKFVLGSILIDILHIFPFGFSGIFIIVFGFIMIFNFQNQDIILPGIFLVLLGMYFLRRNIKENIMLN